MRKLFIIALTFTYLTIVGGVSLKLHYCDHDLFAVSIFGSDIDCGCSGDADEDCCQDENYYFKVQTDHQQSQSLHPVKPLQQVAVFEQEILTSIAVQDVESNIYIISKPPGIPRCRIHLMISKLTC